MRKFTRHLLSLISVTLALFSPCSFADSDNSTPTFPFTVEQFKENYNKQAKIDDGCLIKSIKFEGGSYIARLDNERFQKAVNALKNMNLVNGKFQLKTRFILDTSPNNKVKMIIVEGDRTDPANMFNLIGTVGTVIDTLNPALSEKDSTDFLASLGLMRGDADPTIGQPIMQLDKGGQYNCNNQDSNISMKFGCAITPRF